MHIGVKNNLARQMDFLQAGAKMVYVVYKMAEWNPIL